MFWMRRKVPDKLRFQHYVPITLSMSIPKTLEKRAKKDHAEIYGTLMQSLESETFIVGAMIGARIPQIMNTIFAQNGSDSEQLIEATRDGLAKLVAVIEQRSEANLNGLASSFKKPEIEVLPEGNLSRGLPPATLNSLGMVFLFGYTFGHDYPQLYLEMLKKRIEDANKTGPSTLFIVGMLSIYSGLIDDAQRSSLLNSAKVNVSGDELSELELSYKHESLPDKWAEIYQSIASKLVKNYESAVGPLT